MALKSRYVQTGVTIDHTPSAALTAGDPIQLPDGRAAIPSSDIAANALGAVTVEGIFEVTAVEAATTFAAGAVVGWDNSAKNAVAGDAATATFPLGRAVKATSTGGSAVLVALNDRRAAAVATIANSIGTADDATARNKITELINALKDAGIMA